MVCNEMSSAKDKPGARVLRADDTMHGLMSGILVVNIHHCTLTKFVGSQPFVGGRMDGGVGMSRMS